MALIGCSCKTLSGIQKNPARAPRHLRTRDLVEPQNRSNQGSKPLCHATDTMVVKIRLARFGRTNTPFYNIVVSHARYAPLRSP